MGGYVVVSEVPARLTDMDELDDREQAVLDFERAWWKSTGRKESAIRDTFGISPTVYYLELHALLDRPAALAHDPLLVRRLLRLRETRRRWRDGRRSG